MVCLPAAFPSALSPPAIIASERASSLLWETYNTQKALFSAEPCARSFRVFFFRIKTCEVFICKEPSSAEQPQQTALDFIGSKTFANQRFQLKFI